MRPLTIITGIILGSAFSIAFGLAVVRLIFLVIGDDAPQVVGEQTGLHASIALFALLTAISGLSFWLLIRDKRWWWVGQLAMWLGIFGIGSFYWPD